MTSPQQPGNVDVDRWLTAASRACADAQYPQAHALCMQVITHSPGSPGAPQAEALRLLAGIAFVHSNHTHAETLVRRAIGILDELRAGTPMHGSDLQLRAQLSAQLSAQLHAQLAQALSVQDKTAGALHAARVAAQLAPTDALSCDSIGVVLSRAGEYAEALPHFARAVQLAPRNADFHYNYGAALQFTGRLRAAEAAYARAIALEPGLHRAYPALAQLRDVREPDTQGTADRHWLRQLEAQFAQAEAHGAAESMLLLGHALATTLEQRQEPVQALQMLHRAKRARAQALQHSTETDSRLFAAASALLHAPPHRQQSSLSSAAPIFVVGLPRSGTTLVERILSSHTRVHSAGELPHFSAVVKQLTGTPGPFVLDADTLHAGLSVPPAHIGHEYLQRTATLNAARPHFIDKMPLNFFYAQLLHRALPNARIICMRRQPMDVCLANYRQLFSTRFPYYNYAYDLTHTAHYVAQFERYAQALEARLPAATFLAFDYDALVADQETQTRRLLAFCELPWEPACLAFQENAAAVATASSAQVRQPLYASASGRWRRYGDALAPARTVLEQYGLLIE